ncbi:hypothetical protein DFH09DRAFT_1304422 [Mycena vulgaris]|nr:hypothetical protein DFH09DRAFT_1304422 [Mycena vulgaris]
MALGPVNTTGLPSLPVETLHEIISHFPGVPVPCTVYTGRCLSANHLARPEALRALSETCRRLRDVLIALSWERVEVCASRRIPEGSSDSFSVELWSSISKELVRELVRQTEVITIRNPSLAAHVRVVSVVLTDWCAETVYPEFFSSLSLLPNLNTLQSLLVPRVFHKTLRSAYRSSIPNLMDGVFAGRVFSTVRTLALHLNAFDLVRCCPNVERLTLLGSFSGLSPVQRRSLKEDVPHLRAFTCRPVYAGYVEALAELMPLLYEIPPILVFALPLSILELLSPMKNVIKIELVAVTEKGPNPSQRTEELVSSRFEARPPISTPRAIPAGTQQSAPRSHVLLNSPAGVGASNAGTRVRAVPPASSPHHVEGRNGS